MFGRKKDGDKPTTEKTETKAAEAPTEEKVEQLPPLKPFSSKGTHTSAPPSKPAVPSAAQSSTSPGYRPDLAARRLMDIPGANPRRGDQRNPQDPRTLTVGREISLRGEITACETLVVEGQVDAKITDARVLEVANGGVYTGTAHVEEAFISGVFDGELSAYQTLTVRSGGRVKGNVRYGRIVIEEGGEISGSMATLTPDEIAQARNADSNS
ncbi:polymer-forming cytoskeletal protein [Terasakiella sp. A23]|uniref:bactofilin family protein n=1 Tax=Terasakiella sp. FCG-A23 TaxID=3080561 RepID=UPI0029534580|nr:polymer-forming cytoskeletal protein [Terasakiella sp. A23]MDV7341687.1 polymer-forming cytoskeletal protein [Terasakiella sp. A23]